MTQDRYLGRRLTDRQTAEALEGMFDAPDDGKESQQCPGRQLAGEPECSDLHRWCAAKDSNPEPADSVSK